jgi:hypothetical protein
VTLGLLISLFVFAQTSLLRATVYALLTALIYLPIAAVLTRRRYREAARPDGVEGQAVDSAD